MGKRSADGAAEAARATQKKSKGRMEAIATTDAEQQARTKPEKRVRVGHREPTGGGYSRLNKRRCATRRKPACTTVETWFRRKILCLELHLLEKAQVFSHAD